MKRIFFILFFSAGFFLVNAQQQQAKEVTPSQLERRLSVSDAHVEHQKRSQRAKTWVDRGILMQDIYDLHTDMLYFGMPIDEVYLLKGAPKEITSIQTGELLIEEMLYEHIEIYFENKVLVGWKELTPILSKPLEKAYESFLKAIYIEENQVLSFFQKLFSSSQEARISEAFERLSRQFNTEAILYYTNENYEMAFEYFTNSLDVVLSPYYDEPLDTGLIFNAGLVGTMAEKYEDAIVYLEKSISMNYGGGMAYILMKDSYIALGDSVSGERILTEGYEQHPEDLTLMIELINLYISKGDSEGALNFLNLAKEEDPNNPSFFFAEGALYENTRNFDGAIAAYSRAIQLDPNFFDPMYNLGVVYYNRAVNMLIEANEIMDNQEYMVARDAAYKVLEQAVPYLENAHRINPEHTDTMETLRILYYRLDQTDKLEDMNRKLGRTIEDAF